MTRRCFFDIETTYKGSYEDQELFTDYKNHKLTVVGMLIVDGGYRRMTQLVPAVPWMTPPTPDTFRAALEGVDELISYNGRTFRAGKYNSKGFDGPVIEAQLGIRISDLVKKETDLMLLCHEFSLYGGLKKVEAKVGIERLLPSKDGKWAIRMWEKWQKTKEEAFLELLLVYNKEDVVKLVELGEKLSMGVFS